MNVTWLVASGIIDLTTLIEKMSCVPARIFRLAGGTLRRGNVGDVTVFDPDAEWTVDPSRFRSKGRNTPYSGQQLKGRVRLTVVEGRVIFRQGE